MDQNNFEKNIQQKLDELKIPPSESVWSNVEKKIEKKKRDRRIIFILFFLVIFLLSGGYWLFNSTKNNSELQKRQLSNTLKKESKTTNNKDSSSIQTITSSGIIAGNAESSIDSEEKTKTQSIVIQHKKEETVVKKSQRNILTNTEFPENDRIISSSQNKKESNKKSIDIGTENNIVNQNNLAEKNTEADNVKEENNNFDSGVISKNKISADTLLKNKEEKSVAAKDSSPKKIAEEHQKNKWVFGIAFSGGKSIIGENPFGINNASFPYALSTSGPGSVNNPVHSPSKIKGSAAFIGGIFVEKNISARNKISFGIYYKHFSLLTKVGNRIDSSINSPQLYSLSGTLYSSVNNIHSYRSNFHYLEIPVSVKLQLGNSKTLPLYWQAGITISQLISSNALQFKSSPGLYYNDNSLFNKTQFGLQTGFSAILFPHTKNPLSIGPYLIYNASKLSNEGLYSGKHFSFIGIKTEILFGKK